MSVASNEPSGSIIPSPQPQPPGPDGAGTGPGAAGAAADVAGGLREPDKLVRITSMVRELLEETRQAPPDEQGRVRLREIYERSLAELKEALPDELSEELASLAPPIEGVPTESEIRVAQAQLVGWLEGLFHGIQAAVWAQQMQARAQLEELRRRGLPPGTSPSGPLARRDGDRESGQYL
jgi:hypothetical protein